MMNKIVCGERFAKIQLMFLGGLVYADADHNGRSPPGPDLRPSRNGYVVSDSLNP